MRVRKLLGRLPVVHQFRQSIGLQRGMLVAGLVITGIFLLMAIFAPLIAPYGFNQLSDENGDTFGSQVPPGGDHLLGTTVGGYDVLSRVIWGAQTAFFVIIVAVSLSIFVGVLLGLVSGYLGGWLDRVLVVIADAVYAFPTLLLAIVAGIVISKGQSEPGRRRVRGGDLDHRRVHPAVLPRHPCRGRARQGRGVRRVGQGRRGEHAAGDVPPRAPQLDPHAAADLHAQQLRGDPRPWPRSASSGSASSRRRRRSGATT